MSRPFPTFVRRTTSIYRLWIESIWLPLQTEHRNLHRTIKMIAILLRRIVHDQKKCTFKSAVIMEINTSNESISIKLVIKNRYRSHFSILFQPDFIFKLSKFFSNFIDCELLRRKTKERKRCIRGIKKLSPTPLGNPQKQSLVFPCTLHIEIT